MPGCGGGHHDAASPVMKRSPMKRNKPLSSRSTLKQSGFKPKPKDGKTKDSGFKRKSKPKRPPHYVNAKALAACEGQRCYLVVPGVCLGPSGGDTVVPCHSNQSRHGKGSGLKAMDIFTVPGCAACHKWIDQNWTGATKEEKFSVWDLAYLQWSPVRLALFGIEGPA